MFHVFHGCETLSQSKGSTKDERILSENVEEGIYQRSKKGEVIWRKLYKVNLHNFYCSHNIVFQIIMLLP